MKVMNGIQIHRLMALVKRFEELAHVSVEVRLHTDGKTSFAVHDEQADVSRTHKFPTVQMAIEWVAEAIEE